MKITVTKTNRQIALNLFTILTLNYTFLIVSAEKAPELPQVPERHELLKKLTMEDMSLISQCSSEAQLYLDSECNNLEDLQELFRKSKIAMDISPYLCHEKRDPLTPKTWTELWENLTFIETEKFGKVRLSEENLGVMPLSKFHTFFNQSRDLIKSFLQQPPSEEEQSENFIKKEGDVNRLLTYAALQKCISEKNLFNLHLPSKQLAIWDREKKQYLAIAAAIAAIDTNVQAFTTCRGLVGIDWVSHPTLIPVIFEQKIVKHSKGKDKLNEKAKNQLMELIKVISVDAIPDKKTVCDEKGDALIVV